jgi:hypothetical protein
MKNILLVILFLFLMYCGVWIFNHIHAWAGIGSIVGVLIATYLYIKKQTEDFTIF